MNERCYNPEHKSFWQFGACGIQVCEDWRADNPHGCINFIGWLQRQVQTRREWLLEDGELKFEVGRHSLESDYSPATCEVRPAGLHSQKRRHVELTAELVAQLRRRKRENPKLSLAVLEAELGVTQATLSRALRGLLWACANHLEPPVQTLGQGRCGIAETLSSLSSGAFP